MSGRDFYTFVGNDEEISEMIRNDTETEVTYPGPCVEAWVSIKVSDKPDEDEQVLRARSVENRKELSTTIALIVLVSLCIYGAYSFIRLVGSML